MKGQTWHYNISFFDGNDWSVWAVSPSVIIQNTIPTIDNVYLTGGTGTDIDIEIHFDFIDPDNDNGNLTIITWFVGVPVVGENTTILNSTNFKAGDLIFASIQPNDGEAIGTTIFSNVYLNGFVVVGNTFPEIVGLPSIFDANNENTTFLTNSTLFVHYNASDLDGIVDGNFNYDIELDGNNLVIGAEYRWYKNGQLQENLKENFVFPIYTMKNDVWIVSVRPRDRFGGFGNWVNSSPIFIANSQPEISDFNWVILQPTVQDNLIFTFEYSDIDLDSEDTTGRIIHWYFNNGTEIIIGQNKTQLTSTAFIKGNIIFVELQVYDGDNYSSIFTSGNIQIQNSIPVATTVVINPNYPFNGDNLSLQWEYFDFDNDSEVKSQIRIFWYRNGILQSQYTNKTVISWENTIVGQLWRAEVQVYDGTDYSILNQSVTIEILVATLQFINTQYNDFILDNENISISYSYSDSFLESIKNESFIFWYRNGQYVATYDNKTIITADLTNPGEIWHFRIVPFNGETLGAEIRSTDKLIESIPNFNDIGVEYQKDIEGHYIFWIDVTDSRHPIYSVTLIISNNAEIQTYPLTFNGTYWILNYQLNNFSLLNTTSSIEIDATTRIVINSNPNLVTVETNFNLDLIDTAPPRIEKVQIDFDDLRNPSTIQFTVTVEEFGSGVENITLYYYFRPVSDSSQTMNMLKLGQALPEIEKFSPAELTPINEITFSVILNFKHENQDIEILYFIDISDKNNNRDPFADSTNGLNPNRSEDGTWFFTPQGIAPEILLIMIIVISIFLIFFSFLVIKKFRKTELVGLDKKLIVSKLKEIVSEEITNNLDSRIHGIVISFFHQRKGPIPILVLPDILNDNLQFLVNVSDLSFSSARFAKDHSTLVNTSFNLDLSDEEHLEILSYGFSLDRPEARGGAENLTLNFLISPKYYPLISQFTEEIVPKVKEIHKTLNDALESREVIIAKMSQLREFLISITLVYEKYYGSIDQLSSQE